jgi:hypothetical protein
MDNDFPLFIIDPEGIPRIYNPNSGEYEPQGRRSPSWQGQKKFDEVMGKIWEGSEADVDGYNQRVKVDDDPDRQEIVRKVMERADRDASALPPVKEALVRTRHKAANLYLAEKYREVLEEQEDEPRQEYRTQLKNALKEEYERSGGRRTTIIDALEQELAVVDLSK